MLARGPRTVRTFLVRVRGSLMWEMTGIQILTLEITHHFQIPGSAVVKMAIVTKMTAIKMAQMVIY